MSDSESSVGGASHSRRAGPAKTRAKRKARHVDSTSDDLEDDDAAFSDDGPHERGRAKLSWTRITTTLTWADADVVLRDLACKECNGYALRERHGFRTQFGVCYRFQCGFFNFFKCGWQVRVWVPYDQTFHITLYYDSHPELPRPVVIDVVLHTPQTMAVATVKSGLRPQQHKSHLCMIETTGTHVKHNGYQHKQAHCMFKAYCDLHPFALRYGFTEITNWLRNEKIDTLHVRVDAETGERTSVDRLKTMVKACKRFCTSKISRMDKDVDVAGNYPQAQLLALCQKYCLGATVARLGELHFDADTSYIIPGWSASDDREAAAGGMCVMITTMNLALNYARAMRWNKGNVTLALDHTYKMDKRGNPHFSVNVIGPNQSAHRCHLLSTFFFLHTQ